MVAIKSVNKVVKFRAPSGQIRYSVHVEFGDGIVYEWTGVHPVSAVGEAIIARLINDGLIIPECEISENCYE